MADAIYLKQEYLRKQRERRAANGNATTRKYERTKKGKLMRTYRNMQSRVEGVLKLKRHLYEGKELLSRDAFYEWAMGSPEFHRLYDAWVASGYKCGDSPSVDRIDPSKGYCVENMEWVSHRVNSSRAARKSASVAPAQLIDADKRVVRNQPALDRYFEHAVAPAGG